MACVDINSKTNEETVELIKKDGGIAQAFTCNVAKSQSVDDMRREIIAKMGPVDVVVNNAALVMGMTLKEMTYADIRGMFEVNCMGPIFVSNFNFLGIIHSSFLLMTRLNFVACRHIYILLLTFN